jgi:hypothetical protein
MRLRRNHLRPNPCDQDRMLRILERGNVKAGRRWIQNDDMDVNHVYIKKEVRMQSASELTITDVHDA